MFMVLHYVIVVFQDRYVILILNTNRPYGYHMVHKLMSYVTLTDVGPTVDQHCPMQQTQNICITFVQYCANAIQMFWVF